MKVVIQLGQAFGLQGLVEFQAPFLVYSFLGRWLVLANFEEHQLLLETRIYPDLT